MAVRSIKIDSTAKQGLVIAAGLACLIAAYFLAKWGIASSAAMRTTILEDAQLTAELAPLDPRTHSAFARLLEKNFNIEDVERSLSEYEIAASLAPNNYVLWLDLGRARERSGDAEGAERALLKAQELAPNYSRVRWSLGNALVRQGRTEEGFAEIRRAVASDPTFTNAAAFTAWQIFDGNMAEVRTAIGDSVRLNAAIAILLAGQKRFDEAADIWGALPREQKSTLLKETGELLLTRFLEAKKFRSASQVAADLSASEGPVPGKVTNGGFEGEIRLQNPHPFDWQLATGNQPQIAPTNGQKHSGNNSLVLIFNSAESKDFRTVSQIVAVEPGKTYEFELVYRSDLKTSAVFKWQIADALDGKVLAVTEPLTNTSAWSAVRVKFTVPNSTEGVNLRFVRENCPGPVCPVTGNMWFDDMSIKPVN